MNEIKMPIDVQTLRNKAAHEYATMKWESYGNVFTASLIGFKRGFDSCFSREPRVELDLRNEIECLKKQLAKAIEQRDVYVEKSNKYSMSSEEWVAEEKDGLNKEIEALDVTEG